MLGDDAGARPGAIFLDTLGMFFVLGPLILPARSASKEQGHFKSGLRRSDGMSFAGHKRIGTPIPTWRMTMPITSIDGYEVEFTGELLEGTEKWGAFVAIFAPSENPMHMNNIYPKRRVSVDLTFSDQHAAEAEAERAASTILHELHS